MAKSRRTPDEDVRRYKPKDEDDRPRKRRSEEEEDEDAEDEGPEKPRKKKKSAAGPVKLILRIVGGVIGGILLIILLYWVYSPVGTDYKLLTYFPPETVSLSGYQVEEVSRIVKLKEVHDVVLGNYKDMFGGDRFTENAVKYTDVDKYLSGVAAGDPEEEKDLPPDSQDRRGSLTVIRFKIDVDQAAFVESIHSNYRWEERQGRDGRTFYQLYRLVPTPPDWHLERRDDISFFFPNSKTLVYASTRRELQEAMNRQPGRIEVQGNMRELADKVDGHFFSASTGPFGFGMMGTPTAFNLSILDEDIRDRTKFVGGINGTAYWFASNGNDFLYASATLYSDPRAASDVRRRLKDSFYKAQKEIYASESGRISGLDDPFNPKVKGKAPGGGGFGGGEDSSKDIIEAMIEYVRTARVYNRGRLVVVEGMIPHGMPEQGVFEKFWAAAGQKYRITRQSFGPGGMMGMPGMPGAPGGPGMGPPGMMP